MTHPNTVSHSAGAVCCPDEASARRHDREGWRATWWEPMREYPGGLGTTQGWMGTTLVPATRRWTR